MGLPFYIFLGIIAAFIVVPIVRRGGLFSSEAERLEQSFGLPPENTDYEMGSIESLWVYRQKFTDTEYDIDSVTWNDLDMNSVYKRINMCRTSVGEEYLYDMLHRPDYSGQTIKKREALIEYFSNNPDTRLDTQMHLNKLGKDSYNQLCSCIYDAKSKKLENAGLYKVLAALPLVGIALIFVLPALGIATVILSCAANAIIYYSQKLKLDKELSVMRYFSALLWSTGKLLKNGDENIAKLMPELKDSYSVFKDLSSKMSFAAQKSTDAAAFFSEYFKMIFLSDIRGYSRVINRIDSNPEAFYALYKSIGEIDAAISILSFRKSLSVCCLPEFHDKHAAEFDGLCHPLLDDAVPNSAKIERNSIITGPNASGKSTFIKALAVNAILAQTINTCNSNSFVMKRSLVMTSMAVKDSILKGESYFITEIKSLKRVLDKMEKIPCMCFVDEILRGTNTAERIAASSAILSALTKRDCLCIVASHDMELTKILGDIYSNYHFSETVEPEGVSFDFKLRHGPANTRNAIRLLGFLGYDESIVHKANESASKFMEHGSWELAFD